MKPFHLFLFSLVLSTMSLSALEKAAWTTDYNAAVKVAREQNKSILLLFTGDWISMCRVFDETIMNQDAFLQEASEQFVLVRLNFPESNRLPEEIATQYQLLRDAYRVQGFPAVVLTEADGKPYGLNGFQPVTPELYAEQIIAMHGNGMEMKAKREAAESLEGIEKAKLLTEGIPELPGNMAARYYGEEMRKVIEADPDDVLGRKGEFAGLIDDVKYSKAMQLLSKEGKWDRMIELTDAYIEEKQLSGGMLQKALLNKSRVQERMDLLRGRVESLLQVVEVDGDSGYAQEAQRQLDELRVEKLRIEAEAAKSQEP
ncbi:MAG: thioredoxin family protein [Verrucomicrobiales bacterium]|nr:thioredoxin family protein [Verrucomicrobiales bacterium]